MGDWQNLSIAESRKVNDSVDLLHRAAQFVATFSNSYLIQKPDDSQNCLFWNNALGRLEGRWVDDLKSRMALDVKSFELIIEYEDSDQRISLDNQTKNDVNKALLEVLRKKELNVSRYEPIKQFTLPHHAIDEGKLFRKPENIFLDEWSRYVSNTQYILNHIANRYRGVSEICIWPHHFDMAVLIPVNREENEDRSIGMGLSIADSYVDEPYFYINNLEKETAKSNAQDPSKPKTFWNTKDWTGLVLPTSAVAQEQGDSQERLLKSFFMTAWMHHTGIVNDM